MKFKKLYPFTIAIGALVFFLGNANGPATQFNRQVTGAPGSLLQNSGQPGTCANTGCHSSGAFSPSVTIELLDGANVVDKYQAGKSYTLRIVNTPGSGNPARFGFQAVSLDANDDQAGAWGDVGTGRQTKTLAGRSYVEHSAPSMSGTFEMEWLAPTAAGTGDITFYAASNAVNLNGNSTGDGTDNEMLTIQEDAASSTFDLERRLAKMEVMPNPVGDLLTVQVTSRNSGDFTLRVVDVTGRVVQAEKVNLAAGLNRQDMDVAKLPAGLYILQLCGENHLAATQLLKK